MPAYTDHFIERRYKLNGLEAAKKAEAFNVAFERGYQEQKAWAGLYCLSRLRKLAKKAR